VLAVHAVLVTLLLRTASAPPVAAPPAAILIDLPAAPPASQPAAEPSLDLPPPDMPEPVQIEVAEVDLPLPDMPAPVTIAVARVELPRPTPPPPPTKPRRVSAEPERRQARAALPAAQASQPPAQSPAAQPTAPAQARSPSSAVPTWQSALLAHLERHKRYPRQARIRHQEGAATVRFTIDRDGRVGGVVLLASSGHPALDEETLALLQRASPLPPPPSEAGRPPLALTVPVQYNLR
jgi:protein TonB